MSSFTEPSIYLSTDIFKKGRRCYQIVKSFDYFSKKLNSVYTVESGFITDLGTIPYFVRFILNPDDPWVQAFILHDFLLYETSLTRRECRIELNEALKLRYRTYDLKGNLIRIKCPLIKRLLIITGVYLKDVQRSVF